MKKAYQVIWTNKRRVFFAKHLRRSIFRVQKLNMNLNNQTYPWIYFLFYAFFSLVIFSFFFLSVLQTDN